MAWLSLTSLHISPSRLWAYFQATGGWCRLSSPSPGDSGSAPAPSPAYAHAPAPAPVDMEKDNVYMSLV